MEIESERAENDLRNEKFNRGIFDILLGTKKVLFSVLSYMGRKCINITTTHTRNYISYLSRSTFNDNLKNYSMNTTLNFLDDAIYGYEKQEMNAYKAIRKDLNTLKYLIINKKK